MKPRGRIIFEKIIVALLVNVNCEVLLATCHENIPGKEPQYPL